jgi:UDP-N-acetylglucosamine--N-acetylmuramyl-(pentapeptide) pyrophosphoryl-undecaprenol N-acetylglucosamine transferase
MRLLVSGGGTGGHVYPILAVLQQLDSPDQPPSEICYVGSKSGIEEELANNAGIPFRGVTTASFHGAAPWVLPFRFMRLARGLTESVAVISEVRPQAVLATGGYACAPALMAAWIRRIPSVIYLPDLVPGMAIRFLGRFAKVVAVSVPASTSCFPPGKAVVTGYPVRQELFRAVKTVSRRKLGLDEAESTLLVLGGSQGAHSINLAIGAILTHLLDICQVLHISGHADFAWLRSRRDDLPADLAKRYAVYPYLHGEMIDALASADLVVARAGAATTGEFPALGLPSILIPYPHAGRHQDQNADYMVDNEAAVKIADADLSTGVLLETIVELLTDKTRLAHLAEGASRLAQPDAARRIAQLLKGMARQN